jgi:hypothetical protein
MAITALNVTIPAGESLSAPLELGHAQRIARISMPDDWTNDAPLTFMFSADGTSYANLYHATSSADGWWPYEVVLRRVIPNSNVLLPAGGASDLGFIKLRSGTHANPVVQASDRVFEIMLAS